MPEIIRTGFLLLKPSHFVKSCLKIGFCFSQNTIFITKYSIQTKAQFFNDLADRKHSFAPS